MSYTVTKENLDVFIKNIDSYQHIAKIKWKGGELHPILSQLPNLIILKCYFNQITSLVGLEHCPNLQTLDCSNNKITSLVGLEHCTDRKSVV